MKIIDVRVTPLYVPYRETLLWAWGSYAACRRILVEVITDEGYIGLGEATGDVARLAALEACRSVVIGENPFHTQAIRWKICPAGLSLFYGNSYLHAFAAIEFACLDIQGQVAGRPIYDLLGGQVREHIPLTGYLMGRSDSTTPEKVVAYAQSVVKEFGFQTLKLKAGILPPEREVEIVSALRKAFPGHRIRMDPNAVWSLGTAMRMADQLRPFDLEYLEDPTWGARGMARLNAKAPWMPLGTNMFVFGFEDLVEGTLLNSVDVLLCDPHWYGGIRATTHLSTFCSSFNFDMSMHSNTELGVSMAVDLHVAALLPNLSHSVDAIYFNLVDDILEGGKLPYVDGGMKVPTGPGLGVKLDQGKVAQFHEEYLKHGLEPYPLKSTDQVEGQSYDAVRSLPKW